MANRYAGLIQVPTISGPQWMTLPDARAYQASHQYSVTDPNNPNLSADVRAEIQDPRVQAALKSGQTINIKVNDTTYHIENGQLTGYSRGSLWKPIAAAGAVAAGGMFLPGLFGGAGGASTAAGTSGATGPVAADVALETQAGLSGGTFVAPPAAKGIASWLNPVLQYGLPAAGAVIGAGIQSRGYADAARINQESFREALAYEKERDQYLRGLEAQRYGDLTGRLQPYIAIGQSAADRMAALLGLNPAGHGYTPPNPNPPPEPARYPATPQAQYGGFLGGYNRPSGAMSAPAPAAPASAQPPDAMVTMRAPTGEVQRVSAALLDHYKNLGAVVVNG